MPHGFEKAIERVTSELKTEGFGVLTTIDVQATLKQKIGADFRRYTILGACNPHLAHQVLTARPDVGLLLPCNVVVEERPGEGVFAGAVKPTALFGALVNDARVEPLARDAETRLRRALERAASG